MGLIVCEDSVTCFFRELLVYVDKDIKLISL